MRAGVRLPLDIRATGIARTGSFVDYPTIAADSARDRTDLGAIASFDRPRFAVEAGYWRTDRTAPRTFPLYPRIVGAAPIGTTRWLTVSGRLTTTLDADLAAGATQARLTDVTGIQPGMTLLIMSAAGATMERRTVCINSSR